MEQRRSGLSAIARGVARLGVGAASDLRTRRDQIIAVAWTQGLVALAAAYQDVTREAGSLSGQTSLILVVPLASLITAVIAGAMLGMVQLGLRLVATDPEPGWGRTGQVIPFLGRSYRCAGEAGRLLRFGIVIGYANLAALAGMLPADLLAYLIP